MSHKLMFVVTAVVSLVFGLAFLIVPDMTFKQFGVDTYAATVLTGRFYGTALVALGLVLWFAKDIQDAAAQTGLGIALLISMALGLIVNIMGIASGIIRTNGWITIIIYVLLALGYAFLIFLKPRMKE